MNREPLSPQSARTGAGEDVFVSAVQSPVSDDGRVRNFKGKAVEKQSAAGKLPTEVMEQIFKLIDPETFASLVLVSRSWRKASENPQIYAHHLSRCPSFAASHSVISGPFEQGSLLQLKKQLVQEGKRNLFETFMRPRETVVNIISNSTSSSSAFPYGEKFDFVFSPQAQFCLALSSSRIIVLDTAADEPTVVRELKVLRRPLSACITRDGCKLAVLSAPHKINLYALEAEKPLLIKSVELSEAAHTMTLALNAEVLAAACENGIEVVSLHENSLPPEKRSVKCDRVDHLAFSPDGTLLIGTTQGSKSPSTVIVSAPYFTEDMDPEALLSQMWTSQILFPNSSRDCSHAALLPRKQDHESNWTLTYDRVFESFRAVRTDDLRNGTTYFTGPQPSQNRRRRQTSKSSLVPQTLPSITPAGELVAAAFLGSEIWLYGVPEDLDNTGLKLEHGRAVSQASPVTGSPSGSGSAVDLERLPRWQLLVDKYRNVFAKGRRVTSVEGVSNIGWCTAVADGKRGPICVKERLIIAAPWRVSCSSDFEQDEMAQVDGGKLVCLDFGWGPSVGEKRIITIEVGGSEPELLEEEVTDMDTEIAMARQRTVGRRDGAPGGRAPSSVVEALRPAGNAAPPVPPVQPAVGFGLDTTREEQPPENPVPTSPASSGHGVSLQEASDALDGPYSHSSPRSRNTLYRSATANEANRRRNPPVIPSSGRVEFRRNDGTELPHESDADNWVPPPPPYTKDAEDISLPAHLRHLAHPQTSNTPSDWPAGGSSQNDMAALRRPVSPINENAAAESSPRPPLSPPKDAPPRTIPRRPVPRRSPALSNEEYAARRRSSADVEISRSSQEWAAITRDNGTPSPALSSTSSLRHRNSTGAPRPLSSIETWTRPTSMRAALQPNASLTTEVEPRTEAQTSPTTSRDADRRSTSLTLSGSNLQRRLDYPLPMAPDDPEAPENTPLPASPMAATAPPRVTTAPSMATVAPPMAAISPPMAAVSSPMAPMAPPIAIQTTAPAQPPAIARTTPNQSPATPSVREPSAWEANNHHLASISPVAPTNQLTPPKSSKTKRMSRLFSAVRNPNSASGSDGRRSSASNNSSRAGTSHAPANPSSSAFSTQNPPRSMPHSHSRSDLGAASQNQQPAHQARRPLTIGGAATFPGSSTSLQQPTRPAATSSRIGRRLSMMGRSKSYEGSASEGRANRKSARNAASRSHENEPVPPLPAGVDLSRIGGGGPSAYTSTFTGAEMRTQPGLELQSHHQPLVDDPSDARPRSMWAARRTTTGGAMGNPQGREKDKRDGKSCTLM